MGIADLSLEVVDEPPRFQPRRSALQLGLFEHTRDHPYGRRLGVDRYVERVPLDDRLAVHPVDVTIRSVCRLMSPLSYEIVVRFRSTVTVNGKARVSSSTNGPKITVDVSMVGAVAAAGAGHYERQASSTGNSRT